MISWMFVRPQMQNPTKISEDHRPHHRSSPLQQMELYQCGNSGRSPGHCLPLWCKADCQTQSLQAVHLIQIFGHGALQKYSKIYRLENTTLERFSWRVKSDSNGVALSSPLSRKKKRCKHQPYAKRCILNAQRHKTHPIIIACAQ